MGKSHEIAPTLHQYTLRGEKWTLTSTIFQDRADAEAKAVQINANGGRAIFTQARPKYSGFSQVERTYENWWLVWQSPDQIPPLTQADLDMPTQAGDKLLRVLRNLPETWETLRRLGSIEKESMSHETGDEMIKKGFSGETGRASVNTIPGGVPGSCHETLVVAIGSNHSESVELRVLQAVEHVWAKCRGVNKVVIFWAAKWNVSEWQPHAKSFERADTRVILKTVGLAPVVLL